MCTWLGALRKHITKYTNLYQKIAPGARILLVESSIAIAMSTFGHQQKAIRPAVSVVRDTLRTYAVSEDTKASASRRNPKILLATFSNGGGNTASHLLIVLQSQVKAPLPLTGLMCDSSPGHVTYWRSYDAMMISLPKDPASQYVGALACHILLVILFTWIACGNENPSSLGRRMVLDRDFVCPRSEKQVGEGSAGLGVGKVCYLYSKADQLVLWEEVREHAEEAKAKGWNVKEYEFGGTGHCGHLQKYVDKYTKAVEGVWDDDDAVWSNKTL